MIDQGSKIERKRLSILGCGWLGFPLAQRLQQEHSTWKIAGSTTSSSNLGKFEANGIEGYLLDLTPDFATDQTQLDAFFNADTLIISLPPRLTKNEPGFYPKQIEVVAREIEKSTVKEVIFISSTGIYPELNRIVKEEDVSAPENSPSPDMVLAENIVQSLRPLRMVTILRLGGLLGHNRIPGKYVKGQKNMLTGSIPVNYIHRDDAVGIIQHFLEHGLKNETFNIVSPIHPTRREVYDDSCKRFGWEAPTYIQPEISPDFKIISNEKFENHYSYSYLFPNPLQFFYSLEDKA
ncbi:NAD-dependent epimerase/dehydratase family protein [Dyadobacter arcticus]|uniref:Nucleoside-diphosphate-sugar epimerase n=1 Tax=Dyadobacter arcticus TaxID=1078754 RepID=A0ABX0UHD4_9BACT|nr:NAD-dependent epimerase/dehydratase family protein [Dyadobacter arcticus]NIJ51115.1 nucleoside-diphosphate-sugar epimerase [Dyadobacter arcticus]